MTAKNEAYSGPFLVSDMSAVGRERAQLAEAGARTGRARRAGGRWAGGGRAGGRAAGGEREDSCLTAVKAIRPSAAAL